MVYYFKVACGYSAKTVLCEDGRVFTWKFSDLGLDDENLLTVSDEVVAELERSPGPLKQQKATKGKYVSASKSQYNHVSTRCIYQPSDLVFYICTNV